MAKFKALSNGTMSNPYREVVKGEEIELTKVEAEFYKNSRWLRPKAEVDNMKPQPLMSGMRMQPMNGKDAIAALTLMHNDKMADNVLTPSPMPSGYETNMAAIIKREQAEDAATKTGEDEPGTGNQDPLG